MTFIHLYILGFACCMGLCALAFYPYRDRQEFRENLLVWTLGSVAVSACWPLALIAAMVAATDE